MIIDPRDFNTPEAIDKWHEIHGIETPRNYLGVSIIGHDCPRYLWLTFRWAVIEKFSGRMYRLFRRGQLEETQIVDDLKQIGCVVTYTGDNQYKVDFGCWIKGHLDGIIESGLPEAPKKRHVLECKTHSDKSFKVLVKNGVEKANPTHYAQMQCYMLGIKTDRALYFAVNKNDDTIYTERVELDKEKANNYLDRAKDIVTSEFMPRKLTNSSSFFKCKICPCYDFCFGSKVCKEKNCRTCKYFFALEDGTARCTFYEPDPYQAITIPYNIQIKGCSHFEMRKDLSGVLEEE